MAIGTTCCSMPHGYNLVVINNQVTTKSEIHEILEGLDKSVDPCFLQTGGLNFNTMVLNSDSGEVTPLAAYFNKYLVSVEQLNSILGGVSRQGGPSLQVGVYFCALDFWFQELHSYKYSGGSWRWRKAWTGGREEDEKLVLWRSLPFWCS